MSDIGPTAQMRVDNIRKYVELIEQGIAGEGQLKNHPDGMDAKMKDTIWNLERLQTEAEGLDIVQEITTLIENTKCAVQAYKDEKASQPTPLAASAQNRVDQMNGYLNDISNGMNGEGPMADNITMMEGKLKDTRWHLDQLKGQAKDHPIVTEMATAIEEVASRIADYKDRPADVEAPGEPEPTQEPEVKELAPSALNRVEQMRGYLQEITNGIGGTGSMANNTHLMSGKLKDTRWHLDQLKGQAGDHPIVSEMTTAIEAISTSLDSFMNAPKEEPAVEAMTTPEPTSEAIVTTEPTQEPVVATPEPTPETTAPELPSSAQNRVNQMNGYLEDIMKGTKGEGPMANNDHQMEAKLKDTRWHLDQLKGQAGDHPIVQQMMDTIESTAMAIESFKTGKAEAAAKEQAEKEAAAAAEAAIPKPNKMYWMGFSHMDEGIRVKWEAPPGIARYKFLLSTMKLDEQESIQAIANGSGEWTTYELDADRNNVILNVDEGEYRYYTILGLTAENTYIDVEFTHSRDDYNDIDTPTFLNEEFASKGENRLKEMLEAIKAKAPEYVDGYSYDDLYSEVDRAWRFHPGNPLVEETKTFLNKLKEGAEGEAALEEVNRQLDGYEEHLSEDNPNYPFVVEQCESILADHPELERAREIMERASKLVGGEKEARDIYNRARDALNAGDRKEAVSLMKQALELDPNNTEVKREYAVHKKYADFEETLEAFGTDLDGIYNLATEKRNGNELDMAVVAFKKSFEVSKDKGHLWEAIECLLDDGRAYQAIDQFTTVLSDTIPEGMATTGDEIQTIISDLSDKRSRLNSIETDYTRICEVEREKDRVWIDSMEDGWTDHRLALRDELDNILKEKDRINSERHAVVGSIREQIKQTFG